MIHIVFGASASGSVKQVLREIGLAQSEEVIAFNDILSIGPIHKLHEETGLQNRFEWMQERMKDEFEELVDQQKNVKKEVGRLPSMQEGSRFVIWCCDNAQEQTGLRYVTYLLKRKVCEISLVNTTQAYENLICPQNIYTPLHTGEIPPEKLQTIYRDGFRRILTDDDREALEMEWMALSESKETIRLWRNGRVQPVPEDCLDAFIIDQAKKLHRKQRKKDYMVSAKLIGEVIGQLDQYIGDTFIEYRLRKLIGKAVFEAEGDWAGTAFYKIKLR